MDYLYDLVTLGPSTDWAHSEILEMLVNSSIYFTNEPFWTRCIVTPG